jgi:hypothetical protein
MNIQKTNKQTHTAHFHNHEDFHLYDSGVFFLFIIVSFQSARGWMSKQHMQIK